MNTHDKLPVKKHTFAAQLTQPNISHVVPIDGDYTPHAVDLHDTDRFAQALSKDYDAIVCAYGPPLAKLDEIYEHCVEGHAKIKEAVLQSTHSGGFIIIGGSGSLHTSAGKQLVETDEFAYSWWRMQGLITGSRIALNMWLGVRDKKWSFLSPPGLLRDKVIRTGEYKVYLDSKETPEEAAVVGGIYNEDMAVAIVDEVEKGELAYKH